MTDESGTNDNNVVVRFRGSGAASEDGETGDKGPHLSGKCKCVSCEATWYGTAPVGMFNRLVCPECGGRWGTFVHPVEPPETLLQCICGETLYWLTTEGARCRQCGVTEPYDEL